MAWKSSLTYHFCEAIFYILQQQTSVGLKNGDEMEANHTAFVYIFYWVLHF